MLFQARSSINFLSLVIYFTYLATIVWMPFQFSIATVEQRFNTQFSSVTEFINKATEIFVMSAVVRVTTIDSLYIWDLILNVVLFIPFGFLLYPSKSPGQDISRPRIILILVFGAALSFLIEFVQLFMPRNPSMLDTFANVTGVFVGIVIASKYKSSFTRFIYLKWLYVHRQPSLLIAVVAIYSLFLGVFPNLPTPNSDFRNWDAHYQLQLGNEATLDRSWIGTIYEISIYDRALHPHEIEEQYKLGYSSNAAMKANRKDIVVYYTFNEGSGNIVHDSSSNGLPLNLTFENASAVRWQTPTGLEIKSNTIIKSNRPAIKVFERLATTNQLTVSLWFAAGDLMQDGPARIFSLSKDPGLRNFTIGQSMRNINYRVRTPLSGLNGTRPDLETTNNSLNGNTQHIVATYHNGVQRLYIDGTLSDFLILDGANKFLKSIVLGNHSNKEVVSTGGKWVYCFAFFFPIVFLVNIIFSGYGTNTSRITLFSSLISFGLLLSMEIINATSVLRLIDTTLLFIGFITMLACGVLSTAMNQTINNFRSTFHIE